jgi:hypothetical protein
MAALQQEIRDARLSHLNDAIVDSINAQFGDSGTITGPETPRALYLDLNSDLTVAPSRRSYGCANTEVRPGMWARDDPKALDALVNPDAGFLNRLGQLCVEARIRDCKNENCLKIRRSLAKVVGPCDWERFREWALVTMSCQASFTHPQKLTRAHTHIVTAVSLCHWILLWYKSRSEDVDNILVGSARRPVDLFGVFDVIYWTLTIQTYIGVGNVLEGKWGPGFLPQGVVWPAVMKATERARRLGLCQNRIWNLAAVSERKDVDLPGLMETAQHYPSLRHEGHESCRKELCRFTSIDSTTVRQLHKCANHSCGQLTFPPNLLLDSLNRGWGGAWSSRERRVLAPGERYVAISHVWSDGTGIGLVTAGLVNRCLFAYFTTIVDKLACAGLWWDTISIPTDPVARRKAINAMNANYANAACTVVHDQYLLQFDWADDGSPCLAIVLSPWFTRGWTALELALSKTIKVLFKGRNSDEPIIKDLDADILAHDPRHASRAHWIASSLIRRLRKPISNVSDLLTILKPRSTSWSRDRMIIAGLITDLPNFDYVGDDLNEKVTRAILTYVRKIGHSGLLHDRATMAYSGAFSWSPNALYDMPTESAGDLEAGALSDLNLTVDDRGTITGDWHYRLLTQADTREGLLEPCSDDQSVKMRIKAALQNWQNCLILREDRQSPGPALLVATVGIEPDRSSGSSLIDCRYVGTVMEPPEDTSEWRRYKFGVVRLGNEGGRRDASARALLGLTEDYRGGIEQDEDDVGDSSDEISEDGARGWISSDSEGPRRPKGRW